MLIIILKYYGDNKALEYFFLDQTLKKSHQI